jgi:hypothetical protein
MFVFLIDADVRYCVLESLDDSFDSHLAQAENLSALFVAMNDEVFEIRELAICTIGRLSCMNPAYVMPSLRKTLIQVRFFSTSVMYIRIRVSVCYSYIIYLCVFLYCSKLCICCLFLQNTCVMYDEISSRFMSLNISILCTNILCM